MNLFFIVSWVFFSFNVLKTLASIHICAVKLLPNMVALHIAQWYIFFLYFHEIVCLNFFFIYLIYFFWTFPDINGTWYFLLWHFEQKALQNRWIMKLTKCSTVARSINSISISRWLSVDVIIVLCGLKLQDANKWITQSCCCYIRTIGNLCQTNSKLALPPWLDSVGPQECLSTHGSVFLIWLFAPWGYNRKTDETWGQD